MASMMPRPPVSSPARGIPRAPSRPLLPPARECSLFCTEGLEAQGLGPKTTCWGFHDRRQAAARRRCPVGPLAMSWPWKSGEKVQAKPAAGAAGGGGGKGGRGRPLREPTATMPNPRVGNPTSAGRAEDSAQEMPARGRRRGSSQSAGVPVLAGRQPSHALSSALPSELPTPRTPGAAAPSPPPSLPPAPPVPRPRATHNAAMLAYLGDGIYELYARLHFLHPPVAIPGYCDRVMSVACCEAQDLLLRRAEKAGFFSAAELDVLRWGRNASTGARKAKGRAGSSVYANATALETLIGFLYLSDMGRLHELMLALGFTCNSTELIVPAAMYTKGKKAKPP